MGHQLSFFLHRLAGFRGRQHTETSRPVSVHPAAPPTLTSLPCALVDSDDREDPFQCHSCPGALHFSSQGYFYPPQLSVGVTGAMGADMERKPCRVTLTWAGAAWYLKPGTGPPLCAPSHCCPGRASLRGSLLVAAAAAGSCRSSHLQERLSGPLGLIDSDCVPHFAPGLVLQQPTKPVLRLFLLSWPRAKKKRTSIYNKATEKSS